jgi:TolA-binding protein
MMSLRFTRMQTVLRKLFLFCASVLMVVCVAACHKAPPPPPPPPPSKPATRPQSKPTEAKAKIQQQQYDRGLQAYSQENFEDAKAAFQRVIELGPNTALGLKAQENIRKIQKILKTLEEIKSK